MGNITFSMAEFGRFAYRFTASNVRALLPPKAIGTYLLLDRDEHIYIGRSDTCLRTRLMRHQWLGTATHFTWQPCQTAFHAFCVESVWYHKLIGQPKTLNRVHPARPTNGQVPCPFCTPNDQAAWHFALSNAQN